MKTTMLIAWVSLSMLLSGFSQDCSLRMTRDTFVCGYSFNLLAVPGPGNWSVVCDQSQGNADFFHLSDSTASVTVDQCGTYNFAYYYLETDTLMVMDTTIVDTTFVIDTLVLTDTLCWLTDTLTLKFEDPSQVDFEFFIQTTVAYPEDACPVSDTISCNNRFRPGGSTAPSPVWTFYTTGICNTTVIDPEARDVENCTAGQILFQSNSVTGLIQDTFSYAQNTFFQTDPATGEILINNYEQILNEVAAQTIAEGSGQCPVPDFCGNVPAWCIDTLRDTSMVVVPFRLGGQWLLYPESDSPPLTLADTTGFVQNDSIFLIVARPSPGHYSADFKLFQINYRGDTIEANTPAPLLFQWSEEWVNDTIEQVSVRLVDTCCTGGIRIDREVIDPPGPPRYSCSPKTVVFIPELNARKSIIQCNEVEYRLRVDIEGGRPPYTVTGLEGTLQDTVLISDPIPISSDYEFQIEDIDGCSVFLTGDACSCVNVQVFSPPDQPFDCVDTCSVLVGMGTAALGDSLVYVWRDTSGVAISRDSTLGVCWPGLYSFSVREPLSGCRATGTTAIVADYPSADPGNRLTITCALPVITLGGDSLSTGNTISYLWEGPGIDSLSATVSNPVVGNPGMYHLRVQNQTNHCVDSTTFFIGMDTVPPVADAGRDKLLNCQQDQVSLGDINTSAGDHISVLWTGPGVEDIEKNHHYIQVNDPGLYLLTAENTDNGCTDVDSVFVEPFEGISFSVRSDPSCWNTKNGRVYFENIKGGRPPYSYSVDDVIFYRRTPVIGIGEGVYQAVVADVDGCRGTQEITVEEVSAIALEVPDEFHLCGEGSIELDVTTSVDNDNLVYRWSNGWQQPFNILDKPGEYWVSVESKCETRREYFLIIDDLDIESRFEIPNIFSPNGDGVNDVFRPLTTLDLNKFQLYIYNRWGRKVFESSEVQWGWDGRVNGTPAPADVFVWHLRAELTLCDGGENQIVRHGDLTLIR